MEEVVTDAKDFDCWDIGGCNLFGGEQGGEFYPTGNDQGLKMFINSVPFRGVIWVVNVSQDFEYILTSKIVSWSTFLEVRIYSKS